MTDAEIQAVLPRYDDPTDLAYSPDSAALAREALERGRLLREAERLIETLDVLLEVPRPVPTRHSVAAKELRTTIHAHLGDTP